MIKEKIIRIRLLYWLSVTIICSKIIYSGPDLVRLLRTKTSKKNQEGSGRLIFFFFSCVRIF